MAFIIRYFWSSTSRTLKPVLLALLQVLLILISPFAFAQLPTVNLTVDDSVASEVGQDPGSFILTRSNDGVIAAALVVRVDVGSSTATFGTDYDSSPNLYGRIGTQYYVQIPADSLSVTLTITPVVDAIVEGDETVVFSLVESNNSTYTVGEPAKAEITLRDFVGGIFKDSFEDP